MVVGDVVVARRRLVVLDADWQAPRAGRVEAVARSADRHDPTVRDERTRLEADEVLQQLQDRHHGRHQEVHHHQVDDLHNTTQQAR